MSGIIHKIKLFFAKISYRFKLIGWAMIHSKEVKNYKFLVELRKKAYERKLESERKEQEKEVEKLNIQIKLIDKIINYVK